jgi:hypothetical protein
MRPDHPKSYHSVWEGEVARYDTRPQTSDCQLDGLLGKPILEVYGSDCNIGSVHSPHKGCLMKAVKLRNDEGSDLLLLRLRLTSCVHHEPVTETEHSPPCSHTVQEVWSGCHDHRGSRGPSDGQPPPCYSLFPDSYDPRREVKYPRSPQKP